MFRLFYFCHSNGEIHLFSPSRLRSGLVLNSVETARKRRCLTARLARKFPRVIIRTQIPCRMGRKIFLTVLLKRVSLEYQTEAFGSVPTSQRRQYAQQVVPACRLVLFPFPTGRLGDNAASTYMHNNTIHLLSTNHVIAALTNAPIV